MLHQLFSFQASSRMHRDHRSRSRSRSASAVNRFLRVRAERRGGKSYKRRFKSACVKLLTYFIELLQALQNSPGFDIYDPQNRHLIQRADQAWVARQRIRDNQWTPTRFEVLLPRLDTEEDEVESIVAETLAVSSESEGEALPVVEPFFDQQFAAGRVRPSSASASSGPAILQATPKIRAAAKPSSQRRAVPASETIDLDRLHRLGIQLTPQVTRKFRGKVIFSIDWHQVLDCIRLSSSLTIRPLGYQLVREAQQALQQLRDTFEGCIIVVNSYCCSPAYRAGVASVFGQTNLIDVCITTTDRTGVKGKLAALGAIADSSCTLVHFDDSTQVLKEFRDAIELRHHSGIGAFGIRVPRHWRWQRELERIQWHKNIVEAISDACRNYRVQRH